MIYLRKLCLYCVFYSHYYWIPYDCVIWSLYWQGVKFLRSLWCHMSLKFAWVQGFFVSLICLQHCGIGFLTDLDIGALVIDISRCLVWGRILHEFVSCSCGLFDHSWIYHSLYFVYRSYPGWVDGLVAGPVRWSWLLVMEFVLFAELSEFVGAVHTWRWTGGWAVLGSVAGSGLLGYSTGRI